MARGETRSSNVDELSVVEASGARRDVRRGHRRRRRRRGIGDGSRAGAVLAGAVGAALAGLGFAGTASADQVLNNSTLSIDYFGAAQANTLTELYYTGTFTGNNDNRFNPINPGLNAASILNAAPQATNLLNTQFFLHDENGGLPAGASSFNSRASNIYAAGNQDNVGAFFYGTITVGGANLAAGNITFNTGSDDGSFIYVDLNNDGIFQASELVVNNGGPHGVQQAYGTRNLAAGTYHIGIGFYEGNGGGSIQARYFSGTSTNINDAGWKVINPGAADQAGIWSGYSTGTYQDFSAENLTVSGNSTLDLTNSLGVQFANLTVNAGATLNVPGRPAAGARFAGTSLTGAVTINNTATIFAGPVTGAVTTLTKQGAGSLDISGGANTAFAPSSTVAVQGGSLVVKATATESGINGATIQLSNGGTFVAKADLSPGTPDSVTQAWVNANLGQAGVNLLNNGGMLGIAPDGFNTYTGQMHFRAPAANNNALNDFRDRTVVNGVPGVGNDNFTVMWLGYFTPSRDLNGVRIATGPDPLNVQEGNPGPFDFIFERNDDDTSLYIDLNQNGIFETGEEMFRRGCCDSAASPVLNLVQGERYLIGMANAEGGGDAFVNFWWSEDNFAGSSVWTLDTSAPNPSNGEFGSWTSVVRQANFSASNVNVTGTGGAIQAEAAEGTTFGNLNVAGGATLAISGYGPVRFAQTSGNGAIAIDNELVTYPGPIVGAPLASLTKTGSQALVLDSSTPSTGLGASTVINVDEGRLVAVGDGSVNPLGSAGVNLATGTQLVLTTKFSTMQVFDNAVSGTGNVILRTDASSGGSSFTNVEVGSLARPVNVAAGGRLEIQTADENTMVLPAISFAGDGTLRNNAQRENTARFGSVSAAGNLTIDGASKTIMTGNLSATTTTVAGPGLTFDPALIGGTATSVTGDISVTTSLTVQSGTTTTTGKISGQLIKVSPGAREFAKANFNFDADGALTPANGFTDLGIKSGLLAADSQGYWAAPYDENSTYAYVAQFYVPNNNGDGTGTIAFGEQIDDATIVRIDGVQRLRDTDWATAHSTGPLTLDEGWHTLEVRFGEAGGGQGPSAQNGWPADLGFGIDRDPTNGFDGPGPGAQPYQYERLVGGLTTLRALDPAGVDASVGSVAVGPGATLNAAGVNNLEAVYLRGSFQPALLNLTNAAAPTVNSVDRLAVRGFGGATGGLGLGTSQTMVAKVLDVPENAILNKSGPGTLVVADEAQFGFNATVNVNAGRVEFNGPTIGSGVINVASGAALGGSGQVNGQVTVASGGVLAPHTSPTNTVTLTINGGLDLAAGSVLDFNFGFTPDRVNVVGGSFNLGGNGTIRINAQAGFSTGDYVFLDYDGTQFNNVAGTFNVQNVSGPAAFTYSVIHDVANTAFILRSVAVQAVWSGAGDGTTWTTGPSANWTNGGFVNLNDARFDDTAPAGARNVTVVAGGVMPSSTTVDSAGNYAIGGGPIMGNGGIVKRGTGTLTLTGLNTYAGAVTVEAGTLDVNSIANVGSPSALGTGEGIPTITLGTAVTPATLRYSGAAPGVTDRGITVGAAGATLDSGAAGVTFNGVATVDGPLTKTGAGTFTLGSAGTQLKGNVTVNQGTLSVAGLGAGTPGQTLSLGGAGSASTFQYTGPTHTSPMAVNVGAAGGTISVADAAANLTLTGAVAGPTLGKTGAGALTLPGQVSFTGNSHTVSGGTVAYTNVDAGSPNVIGGTYTATGGGTVGMRSGAVQAAIALSGGSVQLIGGTQPGMKVELWRAGMNGMPDTSNPGDNGANGWTVLDNLMSPDSPVNFIPPTATWQSTLGDRPAVANMASVGGDATFADDPHNVYYGVVVDPNDPSAGARHTLTRWSGRVNIEDAGPTTFFTSSDDGSMLWVDGQLVVYSNFLQGMTTRQGTIDLTAGEHEVVFAFFEHEGGAGMIAEWQPAGGERQFLLNSQTNTPEADVNFANTITVAAGTTSGIDMVGLTGTTTTGALTINGGATTTTLNVSGLGRLAPASVSFVGNNSYAINVTSPGGTMLLGHPVTGGPITLSKGGAGTLVIEAALAGVGPAEFAPGSVLNANGGDLVAVGGAGFKNPLGAASIGIGDGTLTVTSKGGDLSFANAVTVTGNGGLSARRAESGIAGFVNVTFNNVTVQGGASLNLSAADNYTLNLPSVTMTGNASIVTNSPGGVVVGNIAAATHQARIAGSGVTSVTGNVTAGSLFVDGATVNLDKPSGPLSVSDVTLHGTLNVNTPGNVTMGNISGRPVTAVQGLREQRQAGAFNTTDPNTGTNFVHGTPKANIPTVNTDGGEVQGWIGNSTYVYTGQAFFADNTGTGKSLVAFAECFDDNVLVKIDGVTRLSNTTWNNTTSTGMIELDAGWHDVEFRFGQGGGGVGASAQKGWPTTMGFGVDFDPTNGFDPTSAGTPPGDGQPDTTDDANEANYVTLESLPTWVFRTASVGPAGVLNVASGTTLTAGNASDLVELKVLGTATFGQVSSSRVIVGDGGAQATMSAAHVRGDYVTVRSGSTLNLTGGPGANGTSKVKGLNLDGGLGFWSSKVDLRDGALIIDTFGLGTQFAFERLSDQVRQGRGFAPGVGDWDGTGGVTSSVAQADPNSRTGIAVVLNDADGDLGTDDPFYTTYNGQAVDHFSLIATYTYIGDFDGDRKITARDYHRIDRGAALGLTGYMNGDANYDGAAGTPDDYLIVDSNFIWSQTHPLSAAEVGVPGSGGLRAGGTAVPEPATLGVLALGAVGLLGRRRRRERRQA